MIDQPTIDRILDAANIVDVVSEFVTLRKRGINYVGLCPFHSDKSPSFYVSPSKNICKCFACGEGGTAVHFIMKHEQLSYFDALRFLAKKYNIEIQERELTEKEKQIRSDRESMLIVNSWAGQYFSTLLHEHVEGKSVGMRYFAERGLREDIIRKFQLGYSLDQRDALYKTAIKAGYKKEFLEKTGLVIAYDNGNVNDRFRGRVIFPVHTLSGKVVAFGGRVLKKDEKTAKYVNSPESEIYHKSNELYGIYFAKQAIMKQDRCFLVEGYMDVIAINQAGFSNVVATLGTAITPEHARKLSRFAKEVVIAYDSDGPGQQATQKAINRLSEVGIATRILHMTGAKDPDEYIKKYGPERFQALLDGVGNALDFRLKRLRDQYDLSQDAQRLQYVKEAVEMLAERSNPTEQEVYAGRLAEETNISKTAILAQLGTAAKRAGGKYRREKNRELLRSGEMNQIKVPYSAGGSQALGIASAQQRLLAAILREPRYLELAKQQLTAEQFIQPQQKELYEAMLNCSREGVELSLTALRAFVSEEALNELSRLAAQYSDVNCTPEDIHLYLDRIARGMPVASKAAAMSGDEITQYLQSMREKKQGTLPEQD